MKITLVIGSLARGGAEGHVQRIAIALHRVGYKVTIFCLSNAGELVEEARNNGVEVLAPKFVLQEDASIFRRIARHLWVSIQLVHHLLTYRPRVLHTFLPEAAIVGGIAGFLCRVPVRIAERRSLNNFRKRRRVFGPLESWVLAHLFHAVIGNSRAIIQQLIDEGLDPGTLALIHNGIAMPELENVSVATSKEIDGRLVLVKVANLIPYKGHVDLLKSLKLFNERFTAPWDIYMLGKDSGILNSLEEIANDLGINHHIHWQGGVDNVQEYLRDADISILASHEEGFSNAILESMANGLPVICTDVGGNSEAITHQETGFVVSPRDHEALAEALELLANDKHLRKTMGEKASKVVKEKFSLEKCVGKYVVVLEALSKCRTIEKICDRNRIPIL